MADSQPWQVVFWTVAAFMLPGLVCCWPRAGAVRRAAEESAGSVVLPFREFISAMAGSRPFIIAFVLLYKIGDTMSTALSTKFFLDIGFTTKQIGLAPTLPAGGPAWPAARWAASG
jgi:PAT family beta-lactamase induction signal transducer AmpG